LLSDPCGDYLTRLRRMAEIAVIGALLTALGYGIGRDAWGWIVLALFVVTVLGGLALSYGMGAYLGGLFLNIWFLLALSAAAGYPAGVSIHPWNQALAWLIGSAIAIALAFVLWLARGRGSQPSPLPGVPAGHRVKLSRPIVAFVLLRAFAVSAAAAIAFGLHVEDADWMPLAAIVAMKTNLQQTTLRAVQRLVGTALGAAIASVFLVTVTSHHALEQIVIVLFGLAGLLYGVNYAFYATAEAAAILIAADLPHPANMSAEGRRILFTFVGVAIAVVFTFVAGFLAKRNASTPAPPGNDPDRRQDSRDAAAPHDSGPADQALPQP
jgi:uncharacterized membrane protein YccC